MLDESTIDIIDGVIDARKHMAGALLPILHGVQDAVGHIPAEAVGRIAKALNLSRAEVHGVVTYYPHFRTEPPGLRVVQVCRAEACQAMGADRLWAHACASLGCGSGADADAATGHAATSRDGAFTLAPVYCLGLCALSPAVMVDGRPHARVSPGKLDRLVGLTAPAQEPA